MIEEFETIREFNIKFPSKIYICSRCGSLVSDPYHCIQCDNERIFKPIELEKGKANE